MGEDGGNSEPKLNIHDSVVMGDINIHTSYSDNAELVEFTDLNLPTGEALVSFINDYWLDVLEKHTTEKISLEDHSKVLLAIERHIWGSEHIERKLRLTYREIIRKTLLDNRSMSSPLIQSELGIINALTFLTVDEFSDFRKIMNEVEDRIKSINEFDTESIGLFEAYRWYGKELGFQDLLAEICADAIFDVTTHHEFMGNHGDWLIPLVKSTHNPQRHIGFFNSPFSKVRLDRDDGNGTFIFENILHDKSTELRHFEEIIRIVFSPEFQMYPPLSFSKYCHITRFNTVTYSVRLATIKCAEMLRGFTHRRDEQKIEDFWTWLNLISFVVTFHVDDIMYNEYDDPIQYSLSQAHADEYAYDSGREYFSEDDVDKILPDIEKLFSVIEKVSKQVGTVIQSRMRKTGRAQQASSMLNSINAAYFLGHMNHIKWKQNRLYVIMVSLMGLLASKKCRGFPSPTSQSRTDAFSGLKSQSNKASGFDQFFTEWQSGKSLH